MTVDAPITLPGSRVLLGWWGELAPLRPRRLLYAHALLHRVEALVEVSGPSPLEGFHRALLGAISAARAASPAELAAALRFPPDVLGRLLSRLEGEGLVAGLRPTEAGREAMARGEGAARRHERRAFAFLDGVPAHFAAIPPGATLPLTPPAGWRFDLAALEAAIGAPPEWKARHGFPADVARLLRPPAEPTAMDSPRVPVDRAEQALLVLVESEREGGRVLAYPTRPDGWPLGTEPAWSLPGAEALAEVASFDAAAWAAAWAAWCRHRSLPTAEVEASRLEVEGHKLRVHAPTALVERLRQGGSESLEGKAWLLAGTGRVRAAACLELLPA